MISQATASSYPLSSIIPHPRRLGISTLNPLGCLTCLHASPNSLFSLKFFCHCFLRAMALCPGAWKLGACSIMQGLMQAGSCQRVASALRKSLLSRVGHRPNTDQPYQADSDKWLLTHLRRYSCSQCAHRALPSQPALLICKYAGGRFYY